MSDKVNENAKRLAKIRKRIHKPTRAIPDPKKYNRKKEKERLRKEQE